MSSDDDIPDLVAAKVPVTILTGFLGSGKTTLIQYILTQPHKLKIAVIVNEFEFGRSIEKGLTMQSSDKEDDEWLELNNGCLCCTAKTQTVLALENLIRKKGSLDLILIETSGLADPCPVAAMFWQDDALQSNLYLAGIVTVVDSSNIAKYLKSEQYREAQQQLLVADRILLNKEDLILQQENPESAKQAVIDVVRSVNPLSTLQWTSFSKIENELKSILLLNTTKEDVIQYMDAKKGQIDGMERAEASSSSASLGSPPSHTHSNINSVQIEISPKVVPEQEERKSSRKVGRAIGGGLRDGVDALYAKLLYHDNADGAKFEIVRSKAVMWVHLGGKAEDGEEEIKLYQVQTIGETFDVQPMASAADLPWMTSRFLILGKDLEKERMAKIVEAAFNYEVTVSVTEGNGGSEGQEETAA